MRGSLRGRVRLAALIVVLGLAAAGVAYATIPDSSGVIHGCYHKNNGSLRVVGTNPTVGGGACSSNELALDWSQAGSQGPTGPSGPAGASGPSGPAGTPGAAGPSGASGPEGTAGAAGTSGPSGAPGTPGAAGTSGPSGPPGTDGTAGPTSFAVGAGTGTGTPNSVINHAVTAAEAGITILTNPFLVQDIDPLAGGTTTVGCLFFINGVSPFGSAVMVRDTDEVNALDTATGMNLNRVILAAGDVVEIRCASSPEDSGEALFITRLLMQRVGS